MASFIRSLLQVLLGVVIGFFAATYLLPEARRGGAGPAGPGPVARPASPAPAGVAAIEPARGEDSLFGRRGGGSSAPGPVSQPKVEEPRPAPPAPVAVVEPAPKPEPEPAPAAPAADEPVDFRELCVKPAAWPPTITLNKEMNAQVMQGEEVIAEIPLNAGEKLQVSKVFGDGTAEVRAKGAKFIVKAADTDLAAQARVRLAEISGRVRAPVAPSPAPSTPTPTPAPAVEPTPVAKAPAASQPKAPPASPKEADLDNKMRSLFGTPQKR